MKSEYYEIYEMLYTDYVYENEIRRRRPFPYNEYYFIKIIRKSIDKADREGILRPDAKYFLIVNFHHLIIRPLIEHRPSRDFINEKELFGLDDSIQSDIETIISETKIEENEQDISGHQIMKTIDRLWKTLKTTKINLWG
jgi:hypothetical protein